MTEEPHVVSVAVPADKMDLAILLLETAITQSKEMGVRVRRLEINVNLIWLVVSVATSAWVVGFIVGRLTSS